MARILRTPQANEDLFSIWAYVAERDPSAADRLIRRLDDTFRTLASRPGIGHRQDRYRPGLRCFPVGSYLIFSLPINAGIEVIRVLHGARGIPALLASGEDAWEFNNGHHHPCRCWTALR